MDRLVPRKRDERINEEIRVPRVRLVDEDGGQVGITADEGSAASSRTARASTSSRSRPAQIRPSRG